MQQRACGKISFNTCAELLFGMLKKPVLQIHLCSQAQDSLGHGLVPPSLKPKAARERGCELPSSQLVLKVAKRLGKCKVDN